MDLVTILGLTAGALTSVSFFPQVLKTWRSRSAKDVSLVMFLVLAAGIVLWIVYGVITRSLPVILANAVTLVLIAMIIALKLRYE